jgi:hypothetical protein
VRAAYERVTRRAEKFKEERAVRQEGVLGSPETWSAFAAKASVLA